MDEGKTTKDPNEGFYLTNERVGTVSYTKTPFNGILFTANMQSVHRLRPIKSVEYVYTNKIIQVISITTFGRLSKIIDKSRFSI